MDPETVRNLTELLRHGGGEAQVLGLWEVVVGLRSAVEERWEETRALERAAEQLASGDGDRKLARALDALAADLGGERDDAITEARRSALVKALGDIADRVR